MYGLKYLQTNKGYLAIEYLTIRHACKYLLKLTEYVTYTKLFKNN